MKTELKRQLIHILFGLFFITLLLFLGKLLTLYISILILIIGLILSYGILKGLKIPLILKIMGEIQREHEKHIPGKAGIYFVTGIIITLVIATSNTMALGTLIVLTIGDGLATLIGKAFGKTKIGDKTLEGTLGGIACSTITLSLLFSPFESFIISLIGMISEYVPIDDSLTIPIFTSIAISFFI